MTVDARRIAILGGGKLGEALVSGLLSSGWREPSEIVVTDVREERLRELAARHRVATSLSNPDAVAGAALVVIAVKPQDLATLLGQIGSVVTPEQTVLSVAAGITTPTIEAGLAAPVPVVQAMPNLPATVHEGMAGICAGAHAEERHLALAQYVLSHVGLVVRVADKHMNAAT